MVFFVFFELLLSAPLFCGFFQRCSSDTCGFFQRVSSGICGKNESQVTSCIQKKNTYISLLSMLFFGYRSKLVDIASEEEKHYFEKYFSGS